MRNYPKTSTTITWTYSNKKNQIKFSRRSAKYYSNRLRLAIWYQQHPPAVCHPGSGLHVHIWKTCALSSSRPHSCCTAPPSIKTPMTFFIKTIHRPPIMNWIPLSLQMSCVMCSKDSTYYHGLRLTQTHGIVYPAYQFTYKFSCNYITWQRRWHKWMYSHFTFIEHDGNQRG